jgi:hypothetical protein
MRWMPQISGRSIAMMCGVASTAFVGRLWAAGTARRTTFAGWSPCGLIHDLGELFIELAGSEEIEDYFRVIPF